MKKCKYLKKCNYLLSFFLIICGNTYTKKLYLFIPKCINRKYVNDGLNIHLHNNLHYKKQYKHSDLVFLFSDGPPGISHVGDNFRNKK